MRSWLVTAGAFVIAVSGASAAKNPGWGSLHRPLHIPRIAPGMPCPTSKADPRGDLSRFGAFVGRAWGKGPAYPVLNFERDRPVVLFKYPTDPHTAFAGSEWSGQKVMWIVDPRYGRPVLVRGRQLDGPNEVRFRGGRVPPRELRLSGSPSDPSYTRLRAPGCYGYQIDGARFSRVIVFEARTVTRD
jgi:hypothetical protein